MNPSEKNQPDAANSGVFRPPLVYLGALVLGLVLHLVFPITVVRTFANAPIGLIIILVAVLLFLASVRTFRAAGTPVPGNRPTTAIVRSGPYSFSRNPIYLAFSLLLLGISIWIRAGWLLVTLAAAIGIMSFVVIPREERYLEARFPGDYMPYKASVRRWL
ncbi:MAG TPA: isoprenylcysteine carboxylmethyltransferase family protein [Gemmatimonadaceae bacterium]|jgi:protein-S-isoprenylcysteine O-methyltransferase Ste14